jgi:hypothetical protein
MATPLIPRTLMCYDRESDQKAEQYRCRSGEAGENHTQVRAVLAGGAMDYATYNNAQQVKQEKYDYPQNDRRKWSKKAVNHVVRGFPKLCEVGVHNKNSLLGCDICWFTDVPPRKSRSLPPNPARACGHLSLLHPLRLGTGSWL